MILHRVEPRSAIWFYLRLGRPTSSEFHRIVTPTGKLSAQCAAYGHRLMAELMLGRPLDEDTRTDYMSRGVELEDSAYQAYELACDCETDLGGFITTDDGAIGCSPDRLVGTTGILELKCPAANTHVGYLLSPDSMVQDKTPQVQGQLYVSEREFVDLVSYHPELPPCIKRVTRDELYIRILADALARFVDQLTTMRLALEREYGPFKPIKIPEPEPAPSVDAFNGMGVSLDDVESGVRVGKDEPGWGDAFADWSRSR